MVCRNVKYGKEMCLDGWENIPIFRLCKVNKNVRVKTCRKRILKIRRRYIYTILENRSENADIAEFGYVMRW